MHKINAPATVVRKKASFPASGGRVTSPKQGVDDLRGLGSKRRDVCLQLTIHLALGRSSGLEEVRDMERPPKFIPSSTEGHCQDPFAP